MSVDKEQVLDAWAGGEGGASIAARLRLTRSQVLGIVHRARQKGDMRAVSRPKGPSVPRPRKQRLPRSKTFNPNHGRKAKTKPRRWDQSTKAPKPPKAEPVAKLPPLPEIPSLNLTLAELEAGQCKFSTTAHDVPAADHRFCGHPTHMGRSYCPFHSRIAYDGLHGDTKGPSAEVMARAFATRRTDASARRLIRQWGHKFAVATTEAVDA